MKSVPTLKRRPGGNLDASGGMLDHDRRDANPRAAAILGERVENLAIRCHAGVPCLGSLQTGANA